MQFAIWGWVERQVQSATRAEGACEC